MVGNDNPDKALVNKILLNDNSAFRELIKNNQRLVFSVVFKMLGNVTDREDVCQDIFIKVYANISGFKFDSKLSTWVARIAYTTCINHLQKKKILLLNDIMVSGYDDDDSNAIDNIKDDSVETPDKSFFAKELKLRLEDELNALPPLYKTILGLYHQEEMGYAEIAQITELPIGTVKSYLFRARQQLKENLTKKYNKEDLL